MNSLGTNKFFKTIIDALFNVFLVLVFLSSLYVCCYLLEGTAKLVVFALLVILSIFLLIFEKKKIIIIQELVIDHFSKRSSKKLLLIIVLSMVVLKLFYSLFFYFDPTVTADIISKYAGYAEDFANNGVLKITIGDNYYFLALLLSPFVKLHIPYHIGMFALLLLSMIIYFLSFKDIIGKEKAFTGIMLYVLMPSTMLLTFCPTVEIYLILFISLFIFLINKMINTSNLIYALLLIIICFITCKLNYSGYLMIIVLGFMVFTNKLTYNKKLILVSVLILSIVCSNLFRYEYSYEWRNKERTYLSLLNGSDVETHGRFRDDYLDGQIKVYVLESYNNVIHIMQERIYKNKLVANYNALLSNPKDLVNLLCYKFYTYFSGNHYSTEMLYNINKTSDISFYSILGINEIIYIIVIINSLARLFIKEDNDLSAIKLLLLLIVVVLMINETNNRYSLFITPFLYLLCMNKTKKQ